jgi:hypothetical protein
MITQLDTYAMLFVLAMIVIVIVMSVVAPLFWRDAKVEIRGMYFYLPVFFLVVFFGIIALYFAVFLMKKASPGTLNKVRYYASMPVVTFLVTLGIGTSVVFTSNEVVKRVGIAGLALFGCWLITFPNFIRREMGITLNSIIDTGVAWTDPVYTGLGVVLFGVALVLQYFFVDAAG